MVLLIGNYPLDRQQSMQRFALMMRDGLERTGLTTELIQPEPFFGKLRAGNFLTKWLAYFDKFVFFPRKLRRRIASARPSVVHIIDHSNAMYSRYAGTTPTLVTVHDLLAVRGALGEETDTPASFAGKFLQRWIVAGLRRATAIACVSNATRDDAERLVRHHRNGPRIEVILSGLNYPYRRLDENERRARLEKIPGLNSSTPFVLHVGSNLRRKNREAVLRIFARVKNDWNGALVFAGDTLSAPLQALARELDVSDRIVEVSNASSEILETLYNSATALIFPSRFEGFGWPIAEAQACGCPVICSNCGPMPEVAGDAGLIHSLDDKAGFAAALLRLTNPEERDRWSVRSLRNAQRFETERMINDYVALYREIAGPNL